MERRILIIDESSVLRPYQLRALGLLTGAVAFKLIELPDAPVRASVQMSLNFDPAHVVRIAQRQVVEVPTVSQPFIHHRDDWRGSGKRRMGRIR